MHVHFDDAIPCAMDPNNVSLDVAQNLQSDIQSQIDQLSFEIGLQLGNYNGKFYSFSLVLNPHHSLKFTQAKWEETLQLPWQVVST